MGLGLGEEWGTFSMQWVTDIIQERNDLREKLKEREKVVLDLSMKLGHALAREQEMLGMVRGLLAEAIARRGRSG